MKAGPSLSVDSAGLSSPADLRLLTYRTTLVNGELFSKYKHGRKQPRWVWVNKSLTKLFWGVEAEVSGLDGHFIEEKAKGELELKKITKICLNPADSKSKCPLFTKRFSDAEDLCLSIECSDRTIDLEAVDKSTRENWATGLAKIVFGKGRAMSILDSESPAKSPIVEDEGDETDKAKRMLKKGQVFKKCKKGKSQVRLLWVNSKCSRLYWGAPKQVIVNKGKLIDSSKAKGYIRLSEISEVWSLTVGSSGKPTSECPKFKTEVSSNPSCCISLKTKDRTVDLVGSDARVVAAWVKALDLVLNSSDLHANLEPSKSGMISSDEDGGVSRRIDENEDESSEGSDGGDLDDEEMKAFLKTTARLSVAKPRKTVGDDLFSPTSSAASGRDEKSFDDMKYSPSPMVVTVSPAVLESPMKSFSLASPLASSGVFSSSIDEKSIPKELADILLDVQEKLEADRVFLYKVVGGTCSLVWYDGCTFPLKIKHEVKVGTGVIGTVASGVEMLLADAYQRADFDKSLDTSLKYKTTSLLALPATTKDGKTIGVVCFANKQDFPFKADYFNDDHKMIVSKRLGGIVDSLSKM